MPPVRKIPDRDGGMTPGGGRTGHPSRIPRDGCGVGIRRRRLVCLGRPATRVSI